MTFPVRGGMVNGKDHSNPLLFPAGVGVFKEEAFGGGGAVEEVNVAEFLSVGGDILHQGGDGRDATPSGNGDDILPFEEIEGKTITVGSAEGYFVTLFKVVQGGSDLSYFSDSKVHKLTFEGRGSAPERGFAVSPNSDKEELSWGEGEFLVIGGELFAGSEAKELNIFTHWHDLADFHFLRFVIILHLKFPLRVGLLELGYNLCQYLFNIYAGGAVLLTTAASYALSPTKFFVSANELVVVPVVVSIFNGGAKVMASGDSGEIWEGASGPLSTARTSRTIQAGLVFRFEAVAERTNVGANPAADAEFFQLFPDLGIIISRPFNSTGEKLTV